MAQQESITGIITFKRTEEQSGCVCCPDGHHVFTKFVEFEEFESPYPKHFTPWHRWFDPRFLGHENEGKRVRITVEVLD